MWFGSDPPSEEELLRVGAAVLSGLKGLKPCDPLEGMLAAQLVATHDAVVSPTFGSHATVRTGPVLPDLRVEVGGPVGVEVQLGKARAGSLRELLQRYAVIASQPDGQVDKVRDAVGDMARDRCGRS